jgi:hypothetical protein
VNTLILMLCLVPTLPQLHGFRLFGINKYWQDHDDTTYQLSYTQNVRWQWYSSTVFALEPMQCKTMNAASQAIVILYFFS